MSTGNRQVFIDANLLLLFLVGSYDRKLIAKHKRTSDYRPRDLDLLLACVTPFETWVTTPNVLSEVSNLASQTDRWLRDNLFTGLARLIPNLEEQYVPSVGLSSHRHLSKFGITDLGIVRIAESGCTVLTSDSRLADYVARLGHQAVDFHLLRLKATTG
jgi:hypothetical protein